METNEKVAKVAFEYSCKKCHYVCYNKTNYSKHLSTRKHTTTNETNEKLLKVAFEHKCNNCGHVYKHRSSLCKHMKTCDKMMICSPTDETQILSNLVQELIRSNTEMTKQNQALQEHVIELCKNGTNNITTNSNNKSFNIQFFLNEQCKNAINFNEFMENIEVSREDLMNTGQLGFVGGISKILIDNLKQLGVHERPIHCTDLKRDTVYIKDNNEWNKEDDDVKIRSAIQEVSRKSMGTLIDWKKSNPDYADGDSRFSQDCISMQRNSIAGYEREVLFPKVIKELNHAIVIDKDSTAAKKAFFK
jgi:hypothetical protein